MKILTVKMLKIKYNTIGTNWKVKKSMAQLFFKYGAMNSGKTIEILKVAHNYEEQNKPVVLMTSGIDTRDGLGVVSSRIGLKRNAMPIFEETDVFDVIQKMESKPYCVLIDEAQFLKRNMSLLLRELWTNWIFRLWHLV